MSERAPSWAVCCTWVSSLRLAVPRAAIPLMLYEPILESLLLVAAGSHTSVHLGLCLDMWALEAHFWAICLWLGVPPARSTVDEQ